MSNTRKLWILLATLLVVSFGVPLWSGAEIDEASPPMPEPVVSADGTPIFTRSEIQQGRQVRQSIGGNSSARCGATAAMSRRTGAPTGCTARRSRCSTCGPRETSARRATTPSTPNPLGILSGIGG